jgi:hypothetical protein
MRILSGDQATMLTYRGRALDFIRRGPLKAGLRRPINEDFTLLRDLAGDDEGSEAMTTRRQICAIGRAAGKADPAATLILGTLLLLIRP